ncbi:MAG: hypothetical protein Q9195_008411 [Heterodermia aff. obscurata]
MLNGKVYVVTSPDLITAINRNSKALAFNPFIAQLGKRITGHSEATSQIVQLNLNGEDGPGYVIEVHDGLVAALSPGRDLEHMTEAMLSEATRLLDILSTENEVELFGWMRHTVTMCSTRAIYGPGNPFNQDPAFVGLFWDFDHDLNMLIANVLPSVLAPKGNRARSVLASAFQEYFLKYDLEGSQSSAMIKARYSANVKHGVSFPDQGRLEVGTLLGILANTVPSAFYMICRLYLDEVLLRDVRHELETTCVNKSSDQRTWTLNILAMREKSQLLHSTFQELLRVHAMGAGARYVREDVLLHDRYLLKRGMVVQMPMAIMHSDPRIWGVNVGDFQPKRFLKQADVIKDSKSQSVAYRPFGGGASMCPGRHFVTLEVMALTALMVLRFDIIPLKGSWYIPAQKQESLATNVFPPERDIRVKFQVREGFEDIDWHFAMV